MSRFYNDFDDEDLRGEPSGSNVGLIILIMTVGCFLAVWIFPPENNSENIIQDQDEIVTVENMSLEDLIDSTIVAKMNLEKEIYSAPISEYFTGIDSDIEVIESCYYGGMLGIDFSNTKLHNYILNNLPEGRYCENYEKSELTATVVYRPLSKNPWRLQFILWKRNGEYDRDLILNENSYTDSLLVLLPDMSKYGYRYNN